MADQARTAAAGAQRPGYSPSARAHRRRPPTATSGPSGNWPASSRRSSTLLSYVHLGTTQGAQQAAQAICRKILRTLPSYLRSRAPFWGYVYGVTARYVADAQRYTLPEHSDPVHLFDGPYGPLRLVDPGHTRSVAQLLATLPFEQREVLVLRVPLRLTVEDTAKIVGMSPATVRLLQHRALDRLRQLPLS